MAAPIERRNVGQNEPESTGLCATPEEPEQAPLSARWITPELLANTREVWSKVYQREITTAEAVEILINVRNLAAVLLELEQERECP